MGWGGGGPHRLQGCLDHRNISQQTGPVQVHLCELAFVFSQLNQLSSSTNHRLLQPRFGLQVFGQILQRRTRTVRSKFTCWWLAEALQHHVHLTTAWTKCF